MEHTYYRIGEVSRATGISKDTLHFYDRIGLLVPDHVDPDNQYRYYSLRNLWQLDIITVCRKLDIPLETVRRILALRDNDAITALLMEYRQEAVRLSRYYQRVADDIVWYGQENERIAASRKEDAGVRLITREEQLVIAGKPGAGQAYHANLQQAAREELRRAPSIRRKYGYVLDREALRGGRVVKQREYLKLDGQGYAHTAPQDLYRLPAGEYAVTTLRIQNERADLSPLLDWLAGHHRTADAVFAEELGLQLFPYLDDYSCELYVHLEPCAEKNV